MTAEAMKSPNELFLSFYNSHCFVFITCFYSSSSSLSTAMAHRHFVLGSNATITVHYTKLMLGAKVNVPCANSFQ